jgi:dihydroxyacetone kinase DhaKLM complex PTS-EIIA-like component DhaM
MYGKTLVKRAIYGSGILINGIYKAKKDALQDLINNCGLILYAHSPTSGLMVDEINGYDIIITDITGTPNSGDFVDGNYFKINGQFQEVIDADTTNILYSIGEVPNIIEIATVLEITNDQLFVNKTTNEIGFFETALTGACLEKAQDFFNTLNHLLAESGDFILTENGDNLSIIS